MGIESIDFQLINISMTNLINLSLGKAKYDCSYFYLTFKNFSLFFEYLNLFINLQFQSLINLVANQYLQDLIKK
jgi:hypothetical protein